MKKDFIWSELYRPNTIRETILPLSLKERFQEIVDNGEIQHMIFSGTAGLGKTTTAIALCKELGLDYILIDASRNGNIDTLRGKITQFASTVSLSGSKYKVVILDEADYLNPQSTQPSLRGFMQEFSNNCRFIFTCNFKNRLIEPLHSRCAVFNFNATKKETREELTPQLFMRIKYILEQENVPFDEKAQEVVGKLILKWAPDWRRAINEIQSYSQSGKVIDSGGMSNLGESSFDILFKALKEKNFKNMRKWVVDNIDTDPSGVFRGIYDRMETRLVPRSIPAVILILADYQYKTAFVADHELNVVACLTEIMSEAEFND